jgi:hypothetical protein
MNSIVETAAGNGRIGASTEASMTFAPRFSPMAAGGLFAEQGGNTDIYPPGSWAAARHAG